MKNVIDILKERGLIETVSHEEIEEHLKEPRKIYCGFDPTADSLHLGNMVAIMGLAWFQRCGHTPVVIVGGATGLVGDPSGKSHERPLLDEEMVEQNLEGIKMNFRPLLENDPSLPSPIYLNNYDWFKGFSLIPFLRDVGKQFRMGPMLAKDSVKTRLASEEGMSFTEFCYQLLQGYDFYHLKEHYGVTMQLGGSDQWGNITAGMELIRKKRGESAFGVTFPLLTRSDGKKFGKSESGAIWLSPEKFSSYELYQYLYRVPDADVIKMLRMITFVGLEEIDRLEKQMKSDDYEPNTVQRKLAEEVVRLLHGEKGLEKALSATRAAAPGASSELEGESLRLIAKDLPTFTTEKERLLGYKLIDVIVDLNIKGSKGEVRRLIQNGGVYINNQKVEDVNFTLQDSHFIDDELILLALGKKNKILISAA